MDISSVKSCIDTIENPDRCTPNSVDAFSLRHGSRVVDIDKDPSGTIFMATNDGLLRYDPKNGFFKTIIRNKSILSKPVQCIRFDGNTLLAGIQGYGLVVRQVGKALLLIGRDRFRGGILRKIVRIGPKEFWVCTNMGLFHLKFYSTYKHYKIYCINNKNGLLSNEVNNIVWHNSKWWVACGDGITILPMLSDSVTKKRGPDILANKFLINGKPVDSSVPLEVMEKGLQVDFSYSCLQFRNFRDIQYRIRLNPNDAWKTRTLPFHRLNNLNEGSYEIEVQAKTFNSNWGKSLIFPAFVVLPPIWQRTWFLVFAVVGSASLSLLIVFSFIRNKQERSILDQQLTEANLRALRAQIKPHFIFNALNSIQRFFLNNRKEEGLEFLGQISVLIRRMLVSSDRHLHSLQEEIQLLTEYLEVEKMRVGNEFTYQINVDEKVNLQTRIPTMLIQPLIENALWHGIMPRQEPGGLIILEVKTTGPYTGAGGKGNLERLHVLIQDNGIGLEAASKRSTQKHESFGLRSIYEKIDLLNKRYAAGITISFEDLTKENITSSGTIVLLNLPITYVET